VHVKVIFACYKLYESSHISTKNMTMAACARLFISHSRWQPMWSIGSALVQDAQFLSIRRTCLCRWACAPKSFGYEARHISTKNMTLAACARSFISHSRWQPMWSIGSALVQDAQSSNIKITCLCRWVCAP
jgi:hypothetical protein